MLTGLCAGGTRPSVTTVALGDQSANDMYAFAQTLAGLSDTGTPQYGGQLTLNSQAVGAFDYHIITGPQTVSSFTSTDWFTNNVDIASAWVIVKGDLTINSGQTFIPTTRKLFTVVYVTGDLSVAGSISMSARGANHGSGSGSNITAVDLRIATGTFSGVTNPQIPTAGGAGASSPGLNAGGNNGTAGSNGGCGGGGSGAGDGTNAGGAGRAGTCFTGGVGGAAAGGAGEVGGGRGGNATAGNSSSGAGNPGGTPQGTGVKGGDGTGGVLVIICDGTFSGSGSVTAAGLSGGDGGGRDGGGSGGGSVTILYGTDSSSITPTAAGGPRTSGLSTEQGGKGGDGTARKLAL